MCLILERPEGVAIDPLLVEAAYQNNADGFGVMMPTNDGGIHVHRIMPDSAADCQTVIDKYGDRAMGIHFRMATHGDINKSQCHPFPILTKKTHGRAMYLMHNGILPNVPEFEKSKSDTWHFIEYVLRPILKDWPGLIHDIDFQDMLSDMIHTDKLLILDGETGEFVKINERNGTEVDGVWLSNTYSLRRNKGMNYDPVKGAIIEPVTFSNKTSYPNVTSIPTKPCYTHPYGYDDPDDWYADGYYSSYAKRWVNSTKLDKELAAEKIADAGGKDIITVDPAPWCLEDDLAIAINDDDYDWAKDQADVAKDIDPGIPGNQITTNMVLQATDLEIYNWTIANPDGMAELLIGLIR
jgi:hypothetical protein|tara:strand:+ start:2816 stop:3874 length:1059 start_codon:yes stop_codon:yes gene_type:complete